MKIALFSDTYLPDINGVATSTNILRNELLKLGHEVLVVTSELPADSDYDDFDDYILRVPGLEIQALYGYRACNIFSFKGMKEIKRFLPEVIHVQTEFGIGIFGRIAAEYLNIPVVYTYHTMWADYSHYINPLNINPVDHMVKKVITKISSFYGDNCEELIVPSQKTKDALIHYGLKQKNIYIIPTGLELERFSQRNETINRELIEKYHLEDQFVVTFLGRIAQEKSIDVLIHAIEEIIKVNQNIKCLIVGGGPQLEELKASVVDSEARDYIIFTGPQTGAYVPAHYHISDVFVSASLSETQGLTYIEAMASNIPVIARYDEQLSDVIEDGVNGYFFYEEELPQLILKMMNENLSQLKDNAQNTAHRFSGKSFANNVLNVYKNAIERKSYIYSVTQVIPIANNKNLVTFSYDNNTGSVTLELTDRVLDDYQIYDGKVIERGVFNALKDLEQIARAYNKALKYLSVKDYTYHQMKKKLMDNGDFDDTQLDAVLQLLTEKNLINDQMYALSYLRRCTRIGIGLNKAVFNLRTYGVDSDVIDACIDELDDDDEYQAALALINSYYQRNTTVSYRNIQKKIKDKLFSKGFMNDTIERAMSNYEFAYDEEKEFNSLQKEYEKAYAKYSKKFTGTQLNNKLIDSLMQKGYNYEDIKDILKGEE